MNGTALISPLMNPAPGGKAGPANGGGSALFGQARFQIAPGATPVMPGPSIANGAVAPSLQIEASMAISTVPSTDPAGAVVIPTADAGGMINLINSDEGCDATNLTADMAAAAQTNVELELADDATIEAADIPLPEAIPATAEIEAPSVAPATAIVEAEDQPAPVSAKTDNPAQKTSSEAKGPIKAQALAHASAIAVSAVLSAPAAAHNPIFAAAGGQAPQAESQTSAELASQAAPGLQPLIEETRPAVTGKPQAANRPAADNNGDNAGDTDGSGTESGGDGKGDSKNGPAGAAAPAGKVKPGTVNTAIAPHGGGAANTPSAPGVTVNSASQPTAQERAEVRAAIPFLAATDSDLFAVNLPALGDPFAGMQGLGAAAAVPGFAGGTLVPGTLAAAGAATSAQAYAPNFVADQVGLGISRAVTNGESEFTLRLNPPELGRIEARLEFSGDRVRAHIVAENRDALHLLQRDSHVLERALAEAGVKTDSGSLQFSLKEGNDQAADGRQGTARPFAPGDGEEAGAVDVTAQVVRQFVSENAVDIRV